MTNWLTPNPFEDYGPDDEKDVTHIEVLGHRWRDKFGNTYHTATVYLNGKLWKTSPITYGYGDHYLDTAAEMLEAAGKISPRRRYASGGKESLWRYAEQHGISMEYGAEDVKRKRDL